MFGLEFIKEFIFQLKTEILMKIIEFIQEPV